MFAVVSAGSAPSAASALPSVLDSLNEKVPESALPHVPCAYRLQPAPIVVPFVRPRGDQVPGSNMRMSAAAR